MTSVIKQTSVQAAEILRHADASPGCKVMVTRSGNVRVATGLSRKILELIDTIAPEAKAKRKEQAKSAVTKKLENELAMLGLKFSTKQSMLIGRSAEQIIDNQAADRPAADPESKCEALVAKGVQHIKALSNGLDGDALRIAWRIIAQERKTPTGADIEGAISIANKTVEWARSLNVSESSALTLARNAQQLKAKKGIPLDEGKDILQLSGRLHTKHGLPKATALQHAIDLHPVLRELQVSIGSIEKIIKVLDLHLPELRPMPPATRISAAVRYLQLQSKNLPGSSPIAEVRQSLADLPLLQLAMPKGCRIDQIHQGSHVRGNAFMEAEGLAALSGKAGTLTTYRLFDKESVHGVRLPDSFRNFENQHVEDLVRGYRFELRTGDRIDTAFQEVEDKRRVNPKALSAVDYAAWAEHRVAWSGSDTIAQAISRFQSQTFFGDVETIAHESFRNGDGYGVMCYGSNNLSTLRFVAEKGAQQTSDVFKLSATRYMNASRLVADPRDDDLPPQPFLELLLLPNPGDGKAGNPEAFTVKRECVVEANAADLGKGKTDCRVIAATEEWDIKIDWDTWRSRRPRPEIL